MKLIKSIEIGYFRSIYKERINKFGDLNIIFGRNDSGKSNILRALNLFFNSQTNPGIPFNFERDFSRSRLNETQEGKEKRKFVYVKIVFNTPIAYRKSLQNEFYIKKSWSTLRGLEPKLEYSSNLQGKSQYVTRFLNNIHYHYIPAIKDRKLFEGLLGEVYKVLSADAHFLESLDSFSSEIRERTMELALSLHQNLGMTSVISPPTDLSNLFQSLDFETKVSESDEPFSLTLQRGDGIQVRHIPEILRFISDYSSRRYHLWGFEEPENSLELANAIEETKVFQRYSQDANKQIIITSHSPAFFNLSGLRIERFYINKQDLHGAEISKIAQLDRIPSADPMELMGEISYLAMISSALADAQKQVLELEETQEQLATKLHESSRPLLFVEGETDAKIISAAISVFDPSLLERLYIEAAGGTPKLKSLSQEGAALKRVIRDRFVCVLVDNDRAGRQLWKNGHLHSGAKWVPNSNGTHWCMLKPSDEFKACMTKHHVPQPYWPFAIEACFPVAIRRAALSVGQYELDDLQSDLLAEMSIAKRYCKIYMGLSESDDDYFHMVAATVNGKENFCAWITKPERMTPENYAGFKDIVEGLSSFIPTV